MDGHTLTVPLVAAIGWEGLIIPLIALAVYVLGSVLGNKREPPAAQRRLKPGGREGEAARPGRRPTELDNFLKEIQRRKEAAEQRAAQKPEEEPKADAERKPAPALPRPRPAERSRPTEVRRKKPTAAPPKPVPAAAIPTAVPTERPLGQPLPELTVSAGSGAQVMPETAPRPKLPQFSGAQKPSAAVGQMLALLRSPSGLTSAVLLNEILGPPRSQRGRNGGRGDAGP